jgi:hypothetical protein
LVINANDYDAVQKPNVNVVTESVERAVPEGLITADG